MNIAFKFICFIGLSILLISCKESDSTPPEEVESAEVVLRLGYRPQALADVTPVVLDQKSLSSRGLRIEFESVANPPVAFSRYRAGEIDAIAGMPLEAVFNQISPDTTIGRPFQAYYLQVDEEGKGWVSLVGKSGEVERMGDLAGKTVMSLPTNQAKYLLRRILSASGLQPDEFTVGQYSPATPGTAFSGGGSALFGLEPAISQLTADGHNIVARGPVSKFLFDGRPVPVSASIISREFVENHPEAYASLVSLVDSAVAYTESHPDSVRQYFTRTKYGGLRPSVASRLHMPVMSRPDSTLRGTAQEFVQDLIDEGFLQGEDETYLAPLFPEMQPSLSPVARTPSSARREN